MIHKYSVGDVVTIKTLDELKEEFGSDIIVPFGWNSYMSARAGGEYVVEGLCDIHIFSGEPGYKLTDGGGWTYPECVFAEEYQYIYDGPRIEYSELFEERTIVGG